MKKTAARMVLGASALAMATALADLPVSAAASGQDHVVTTQSLVARKQAAGRRRLHLEINPAALPDFVRAQDDTRQVNLFGDNVWVRPDIIIADQLGDPNSILDLTGEHPNVVGLAIFDLNTGVVLSFCSGTLINPRTVITAAHCVRFDGADENFDRTLGVAVTTDPDAFNGFFVTGNFTIAASHLAPEQYDRDAFFLGNDIAVIALDERITSVDPAGLVDTAPAVGTLATIVGYGTTGVGSDPLGQFFDLRRRAATNIIEAISNFSGGLPNGLLFTDFENPDDPASFDFFGDPTVSPLEGTTAPGDSGGALFVQDADGNFLLAGVTSGGFNIFGPNNTFGDVAFFTNVALMRPFIDSVNPLRQVQPLSSGNWLDTSIWQAGLIPANVNALRDLGDPTLPSLFFEVTIQNGVDVTLSDPFFIEIDTLTTDGGTLSLTGQSLLGVVDYVNIIDGGITVSNAELDSGWLLMQGGTLNIAADGIYFDSSPFIDLGTVMLDGTIQNDGLFFTDFLDLRGGQFLVGESGVYQDFAGSLVTGGLLDVAGQFVTTQFSQAGGTVHIGSTGLAIDLSGVSVMVGGSLLVDGFFDTGAIAQDGGTVGGTGIIRAPLGFLHTGGVINPGNSVGTLVIAGDYLQTGDADSIGILNIDIDETGADLLAVLPDPLSGLGGNAILDGAVIASFAPGFVPERGAVYRVIETEGDLLGSPLVLGQAITASGDPTVMHLATSLIVNDADVVGGTGSAGYVLVVGEDYTPFAETEQQRAVASALDAVTTPTSIDRAGVRPIVRALDGLSILGPLQTTLQTLNPTEVLLFDRFAFQLTRMLGNRLARRAGVSRGGAYGGVDMSAFMVNPLRFAMAGSSDGARAARALAANAEKGRVASDATPAGADNIKKTSSSGKWSTFVAADILWGDATGVNADFGITDFIFSAGADYRFADSAVAGVAVSFGNASNGNAGREHNANMWGFDFYSSFTKGPLYFDSYLGAHWFDFSGNRPVFVGTTMNAHASTDGFAFIAGFDAGATFALGPLSLGPIVQLRHASLKIDEFVETGAGDFGAAFPTRRPEHTLIGAGGQIQLTFKGSNGHRTKIYTTVTYQSEVTKNGSRFFAQAGFAADPAFRFNVLGVAVDDNFGTVEAGITSRLAERWFFNISLDTDFGRQGVKERRAALGLRYRF